MHEAIPATTTPNVLPAGSGHGDAVRIFCEKFRLHAHLETAIRLAQQCFRPSHVECHTEHDPESGEEWVVVGVFVPRGRVDLRSAYRQYTTQWADLVPWPARFLIRISYDLTST
jgi:hypothetical protein